MLYLLYPLCLTAYTKTDPSMGRFLYNIDFVLLLVLESLDHVILLATRKT